MALAHATPTVPAPTIVTLSKLSLAGFLTLHKSPSRREPGLLIQKVMELLIIY